MLTNSILHALTCHTFALYSKTQYLPLVIGKWESWCGWNLCIIGNGIFVRDRWCLPPNAASRINPHTVRIQRQCWKLSYSADGVISCNYHLRIQQRNIQKEKRKFFRNAWKLRIEIILSRISDCYYDCCLFTPNKKVKCMKKETRRHFSFFLANHSCALHSSSGNVLQPIEEFWLFFLRRMCTIECTHRIWNIQKSDFEFYFRLSRMTTHKNGTQQKWKKNGMKTKIIVCYTTHEWIRSKR